jgi:hypothetical protein
MDAFVEYDRDQKTNLIELIELLAALARRHGSLPDRDRTYWDHVATGQTLARTRDRIDGMRPWAQDEPAKCDVLDRASASVRRLLDDVENAQHYRWLQEY